MNVTENYSHSIPPRKDGDVTTEACNEALAEMYRALKAVTFYPESHPLREKMLGNSYQSMLNLMNKDGVSLIVQRDGLSIADQEEAIDSTPLTTALAKDLFTREIQRLTLLPHLSLKDYIDLLSLLALDPNRVINDGGLAEKLAKRGIQSVIADKIDTSEVFTKKRLGEATEDSVAKETIIQEDAEENASTSEGTLSNQQSDLEIEELLALMSAETDDNTYHHLARMLLVKGQSLKVERNFNRLFPVLIGLLDQNADTARSAACRDSSDTVFQQLALGSMAEHLLDHLVDKDFGLQEFVYPILNHAGRDVVDAVISRLVAADTKFAQKALETAIIRIGPPAVPALVEMLKDVKRHHVLSAVIMLGEIQSRDSVKGLLLTAYHVDTHLRLETIRSLAKIGGREATQVLIDLLQDKTPAVRLEATARLGSHGNRQGLPPLIRLVKKRDMLGRMRDLKKEALLAVGRIGDQQALDPLIRLVKKRSWIAPGRHEELKILAVATIGRLGGESARKFLETLAPRSGRIGQACSAALETIEPMTASHHE